jgi:hypothetical protein
VRGKRATSKQYVKIQDLSWIRQFDLLREDEFGAL